MAFTSAVTAEINSGETFGGRKMSFGTYTSSGGGTGGDIATGLNRVDSFVLTPKGSGTVADAPAVNETFPLASGAVTIVSAANEVGQWIAIGK
jgi:hypothetical protein